MSAFDEISASRKVQTLTVAQAVQQAHVERGPDGSIRVRCLTWLRHDGGGEWIYLTDDTDTI